jgi:hypothetical protein
MVRRRFLMRTIGAGAAALALHALVGFGGTSPAVKHPNILWLAS